MTNLKKTKILLLTLKNTNFQLSTTPHWYYPMHGFNGHVGDRVAVGNVEHGVVGAHVAEDGGPVGNQLYGNVAETQTLVQKL